MPIGIKALDHVEGWPYTEESLVYADQTATFTATMIQRLLDDGGVSPVGLTLASEFGGLNVSVNRLHGVCHNPWQHGQTAGGSSGGSSAAVAGGLVTIASGGDGGGSIRIPAGFNGLVGMKGTAGRIPAGPMTLIHPMTVVVGCMARSVRDVCRWYDVTNGTTAATPTACPASTAGSATSARTTCAASRWPSPRPSAAPSSAARCRSASSPAPRRWPATPASRWSTST